MEISNQSYTPSSFASIAYGVNIPFYSEKAKKIARDKKPNWALHYMGNQLTAVVDDLHRDIEKLQQEDSISNIDNTVPDIQYLQFLNTTFNTLRESYSKLFEVLTQNMIVAMGQSDNEPSVSQMNFVAMKIHSYLKELIQYEKKIKATIPSEKWLIIRKTLMGITFPHFLEIEKLANHLTSTFNGETKAKEVVEYEMKFEFDCDIEKITDLFSQCEIPISKFRKKSSGFTTLKLMGVFFLYDLLSQ